MKKNFQLFAWRFRFVVCASLLYEILIVMHASALVPILGFECYGLFGSVLSLVHMGAHFADCGMTNSITPYLYLFLKNKKSWKKLLFEYTVIPHASMVVATAFWSIFALTKITLSVDTMLSLFIFFSIILETMQSFARQFLYALFDYTVVVASIELGLLFVRLAVVWGVWFFIPSMFSFKFILWAHFLSTSLCLFLFCLLLCWRYWTLPNDNTPLPSNLGSRIFLTRINSYFLRISRNVFSTHFLTPLFAIRFGLKTAGIFFFASKLANIVQSVVKLAIGYSGNGLFARVKNESFLIKQATFAFLLEHLIQLIGLFFFVFILLFAGAIHGKYLHQISIQIVVLAILFLLVTCFEFFFTLYEQWYIVEESAHLLIPARVFELLMLFGVMTWSDLLPAQLLLLLLFTRSIHLGIVVVQSYLRWEIRFFENVNFRVCCAFIIFLIGVWYLVFQGKIAC